MLLAAKLECTILIKAYHPDKRFLCGDFSSELVKNTVVFEHQEVGLYKIF